MANPQCPHIQHGSLPTINFHDIEWYWSVVLASFSLNKNPHITIKSDNSVYNQINGFKFVSNNFKVIGYIWTGNVRTHICENCFQSASQSFGECEEESSYFWLIATVRTQFLMLFCLRRSLFQHQKLRPFHRQGLLHPSTLFVLFVCF
jgi:hypothetical protein